MNENISRHCYIIDYHPFHNDYCAIIIKSKMKNQIFIFYAWLILLLFNNSYCLPFNPIFLKRADSTTSSSSSNSISSRAPPPAPSNSRSIFQKAKEICDSACQRAKQHFSRLKEKVIGQKRERTIITPDEHSITKRRRRTLTHSGNSSKKSSEHSSYSSGTNYFIRAGLSKVDARKARGKSSIPFSSSTSTGVRHYQSIGQTKREAKRLRRLGRPAWPETKEERHFRAFNALDFAFKDGHSRQHLDNVVQQLQTSSSHSSSSGGARSNSRPPSVTSMNHSFGKSETSDDASSTHKPPTPSHSLSKRALPESPKHSDISSQSEHRKKDEIKPKPAGRDVYSSEQPPPSWRPTTYSRLETVQPNENRRNLYQTIQGKRLVDPMPNDHEASTSGTKIIPRKKRKRVTIDKEIKEPSQKRKKMSEKELEGVSVGGIKTLFNNAKSTVKQYCDAACQRARQHLSGASERITRLREKLLGKKRSQPDSTRATEDQKGKRIKMSNSEFQKALEEKRNRSRPQRYGSMRYGNMHHRS